MSAQISAPIRIVALLGVLAAAAIGAYTFTAGPGGGGSGSELANPSSLKPVQEAQSVATKLSAHNVATAAGKPDATAPAAAKTAASAAAPKAKPAKPAAASSEPANGTPTTIASLLRSHKVVVVLLYDPQSKVDAYSVAEAELGAREADAGFIRVDVLDQHAAASFTKTYGVLQDPTVLFFARPGKLMQKLTGFADHDTVAQAATNVALGLLRTKSS